MAIATVSAFRNDAGVTMSRGRMPRSPMVTRQSTSSSGNSSTRRGSSEVGATMWRGSNPSTPKNDCMVL